MEELRKFADNVNRLNMEKLAAQPAKPRAAPVPKGAELREKIREYASSVPAPPQKKAGAVASTAGSKASKAAPSGRGSAEPSTDLDALMQQRDAAGGQYAAMYAELEKALASAGSA